MDSCTANEQMSTHPIKLKCSSSRLVHFVVAFFRCSSYAQNNMALEKIKLRQNMKYPEKTHPTNYYILSGYAFLVSCFFQNFFRGKQREICTFRVILQDIYFQQYVFNNHIWQLKKSSSYPHPCTCTQPKSTILRIMKKTKDGVGGMNIAHLQAAQSALLWKTKFILCKIFCANDTDFVLFVPSFYLRCH